MTTESMSPTEARVYTHDVKSRDEMNEMFANYRAAVARWGAGSKRALKLRNEIASANTKLIFRVVRRFRAPAGWDESDLRSACFEGLLTAVERYDPSLGHAFSTYASFWLRHAVGRAIADGAHLVRVPVHAQQRHEADGGKFALAAHHARRAPLSLDAPVVDSDGERMLTRGELTADERELGAETLVVESEAEHRVRAAIAQLPERERMVIAMRMEGATLYEVSLHLGLGHRERAAVLEAHAHATLRKALGERGAASVH